VLLVEVIDTRERTPARARMLVDLATQTQGCADPVAVAWEAGEGGAPTASEAACVQPGKGRGWPKWPKGEGLAGMRGGAATTPGCREGAAAGRGGPAAKSRPTALERTADERRWCRGAGEESADKRGRRRSVAVVEDDRWRGSMDEAPRRRGWRRPTSLRPCLGRAGAAPRRRSQPPGRRRGHRCLVTRLHAVRRRVVARVGAGMGAPAHLRHAPSEPGAAALRLGSHARAELRGVAPVVGAALGGRRSLPGSAAAQVGGGCWVGESRRRLQWEGRRARLGGRRPPPGGKDEPPRRRRLVLGMAAAVGWVTAVGGEGETLDLILSYHVEE
jgi:hypothetical protein